MTPKQARFVAEYRKDLNGAQAAIRAGYSEKTARQIADELLSKPDIAAAVAEKTQEQLAKADLTAERVLEEMRRLAFSDVRNLFDANGALKPLHLLSAEDAACIAGLEVIIKNAEAGDGHLDKVHKIKIWDKTKTLQMLGQHFALLVEHVKLEASDDLIAALQRGRQRVAEAKRGR